MVHVNHVCAEPMSVAHLDVYVWAMCIGVHFILFLLFLGQFLDSSCLGVE